MCCITKRRTNGQEVFGAPCDICTTVFCKTCMDMGTTEADTMVLAKRILIFCCTDCRRYMRDAPNMKKLIHQLESESKGKDNEIEGLELNRRNETSKLKAEIESLNREVEDKNTHISSLEKKIHDFETSVSVTEQDLRAEIGRRKGEISELNRETLRLTHQNNKLSEQIRELEKNELRLKTRLGELSAMKDNFLVSIDTLTKDNEAYANEIKMCNFELFNLREEVSSLKIAKTTGLGQISARANAPPTKLPQVLIVGNHNVRGLSGMLKRFSGKHMDINSQWKERLTFDEGVELCRVLSKNLSASDYIIYLCGPESAFRGCTIKREKIVDLLNLCINTNLLLVGAPLHRGRPILNRFIQEQNSMFSQAIEGRKDNVYFLPTLFTTDRGYLEYNDKLSLVQHLCATKLSTAALAPRDGMKRCPNRIQSTSATEPDFASAANEPHTVTE